MLQQPKLCTNINNKHIIYLMDSLDHPPKQLHDVPFKDIIAKAAPVNPIAEHA